jgi:WD40 repeat protein
MAEQDSEPFATHHWAMYAMAVTPDGSQIVSGGADGVIRRWDIATGAPRGLLASYPSFVLSIAVTPDGSQIITGCGDGTIHRWDIETGTRIGPPLTGHNGVVWTVAVSPDGSQIISGGRDGNIRRWDTGTGSSIGWPLTGHKGSVRGVTVSPDGSQIVSCGADGTVRRWDSAIGNQIGEVLTGHTGWVFAVAVTPDGKHIISGGDNDLIRWNANTNGPVATPLIGHTDVVLAVSVAPNSREIFSAGGDGTVRRWDTATGLPLGDPLTGHTDSVRAVHIAPGGGLIVSCGNDGTVRRWNRATGEPVGEPITNPAVAVNAVAVTRDGREVISASIDGLIRRWNSDTGAAVGRLDGTSDGWVNAVTISPDGGQIIRAAQDGTIFRWDAKTRAAIQPPLTGHTGGVRAVAFTPDSRRIVSAGEDGTVRRWNRATGNPIGDPMVGHRDAVNAVVVTPDGRQIITAGSRDGVILRWDASSGARLGEPITGHVGGVLTVAVDPEGNWIASGGDDGTVRWWDARTGRQLGQADTNAAVTVVRFSVDGRRIISGGVAPGIRQWDVDRGEQVGDPLIGHEGTVTSLALMPEGDVLFSGAADGTVRKWDLAAGTPLDAPAVPRGVLAEVVSDLESDVDRLDITDDVNRIGAVLCALSVRPPLSVALLGDWGTGKSSFMRQLRKRLEKVAEDSGKANGSVFASNIRQVTFNAWHYSDDHLWVGLVEHMFRELATGDSKTDAGTAQEIADLKVELSTKKAERARLTADLEAVDRIRTEAGWFGALWEPLRSARVVRAAVASGWRELRWVTVLTALLAVAGIVLAVRFGQTQLAWVSGAAAVVAGLVAPVVTVWRKLKESTAKVRGELLARKDELDKEIQKADDDLGQHEPAHRLDRLLAEISTTDRYESFRGLTGRIHHDLRRLSDDLASAREKWLADKDEGAKPGGPPLQRIVLYVDDLDRCTPSRVVDVLQAVNLLLTMDLFMVVVAVDPRWLLKALSRHHRGLLRDVGAGHQVSPLDYLDKIFHIPFALRPMGARAGDYLRSMLPVGDEPEPEPQPTSLPVMEEPVPEAPALDLPEVVLTAEEKAEVRWVSAVLERQMVPPSGVDLNPEGLRVRQREQDFLARLTPLLPTPRAVKKLTNLYRLVRLSVPSGQLDEFIGDREDGPYQAAALLLAALVGAPRDAHDLLVRLTAAVSGLDVTQVLDGHRLAGFVEALRRDGVKVHGESATYRSWATTVARYGFETYTLFAESEAVGP